MAAVIYASLISHQSIFRSHIFELCFLRFSFGFCLILLLFLSSYRMIQVHRPRYRREEENTDLIGTEHALISRSSPSIRTRKRTYFDRNKK